MSMLCYKGKKDSSTNKDSQKLYGLGYVVVTSLLQPCNYLNKGFHVFCDNLFTSVSLVKQLYNLQTFLTGTVRKNKKHLPNGVKERFEVGGKKYYRNGNVAALTYRQKKSQKQNVILLSSKAEIKDVEDTKRRHGRVATEKKPQMILDYCKHMGGTDTFDMMLYAYLDERRTLKYWKKVTLTLFARIIINGHIIYKENCLKHGKPVFSRYKFTVNIIKSIGEEWLEHQNEGTVEIERRKVFGVEKLPGKQEKTCVVCSRTGPSFKTGRKRSRTVCINCKEGCHGPCLSKHICK